MKKYLLLAAMAFTFASCTDEDQTPVPTDPVIEGSTLSRVETFSYRDDNGSLDWKRVQLFEEGQIVSDSLFQGGYVGRTVHVRNGDTYTKEQYVFNGETEELQVTETYQYDNMGRLIEVTHEFPSGDEANRTIAYGDNTIEVTYNISSGESATITYTTNEDGIIDSVTFTGEQQEFSSLVFDGDKPVQATGSENESMQTMNFTYYNNPMPLNMVKSAIQINNKVLEDGSMYGGLASVAENSNYFLQSIEIVGGFNDGVSFNYEKTFNEAGYLVSDAVNFATNTTARMETFYYYNE